MDEIEGGWGGVGGEGGEVEASRIDADLVMRLQSENLRLAGLRPSTAPTNRLHHNAEDKERISAMLRFKKHVQMEELQEKQNTKLDQLRSKIRQAHDTKTIIRALRDRTRNNTGLNLKTLQKPYTQLRDAAAKQAEIASTAHRAREQRASHVRAQAHVELWKQEQHERLRVQKQEDVFKQQLALVRNRTPTARPTSATSNPAQQQLRNVRHDTRDFSLQMMSRVNLLSKHMQRAEIERKDAMLLNMSKRNILHQRLASNTSTAESKLQQAMSARARAQEAHAEKAAIENLVQAKKAVAPVLKALESGMRGKNCHVARKNRELSNEMLAAALAANNGEQASSGSTKRHLKIITPSHDSAVTEAAEAAVRPASPGGEFPGRSLSPRQFAERPNFS